MNVDFWRFAGIFFLSLLTGLVSGQVAICLVSGMVLFIIWHYRVLYSLLEWLKRGNEINVPEVRGVVDDIFREIVYLKSRHKTRKDKLSGFLQRFKEATAALPDAVIVLGDQDTIEWANDNAGRYLGIQWPRDAGQRLSNLVRHPRLVKLLGRKAEDLQGHHLQLESPVNPDLILEFRITRYAERHKLLVARDITSIQRANQMRKDFIANASHELRSPLTVITGYLEGLDDEIGAALPEWKSNVKQMRKQAERMQRLIDDLLQLSSLESSVGKEDFDVVIVPELLASIYQEAQTLSGDRQHIFYLETDTSLWIHGRQSELYSAFSNIIFNAVQYTPGNGIIRIRWFADDRGAHMVVTDNGPGIAHEHIPRLTERFYRVDKGRSRESGGTGLGLAIVKHVLARHGGTLEIESQMGVGSIFRCNLPLDAIVQKPQAEESLSA